MTTYSTINLFVENGFVVLQPSSGKMPAMETLSISLKSGSVEVASRAPVSASSKHVLGILGICKLHTGVCVISVTSAKLAARIGDHDIFEVVTCELNYDSFLGSHPDNAALLTLLREAVNPHRSGRGLYFSYTYGLTRTVQNGAAALKTDTLAAAADPRFFWNRAAARPLLDAGASRFVLPMILGLVQQASIPLGKSGAQTSVSIIARRGVGRCGTRHWRRGADKDGNVANFVETEQILTVGSGTDAVMASYVQVRGSIPLLWTQIPNIKYKPTTLIGPHDANEPVFQKHVRALLEEYKQVVAINLVNSSGSEGRLEVAFRAEAERFAHSNDGLRYIAFDFHHACKKGRYENLSILWDQVAGFAHSQAYYFKKGETVVKHQNGVLRTNCIDCLDRTNVVQGVLARKALEAQLRDAGMLGSSVTLPEAYPELEKLFKILWADHGDAVSMQYAGTGAMKSAFTRTGKRDFAGVIDDGIKALSRYYLNNFEDGRKQDAMDLITGSYVPTETGVSPLKPQRSPLVPLLIAVISIVYALTTAGQSLSASTSHTLTAAPAGQETFTTPSPSSKNPLTHIVLPLLCGLALIMFVIRNGKFLVNRPQLCPHLAYTVIRHS